MELCTTAGCTKAVRNKTFGLCKQCNVKRVKADTACVYEQCGKPIKARRLCNTHYAYWRKGKIAVETAEVQKRYRRVCVRYACGKTADAGEFCHEHRHDERFANSPVCRVEKCSRPATFIPATGTCPAHRGMS